MAITTTTGATTPTITSPKEPQVFESYRLVSFSFTVGSKLPAKTIFRKGHIDLLGNWTNSPSDQPVSLIIDDLDAESARYKDLTTSADLLIETLATIARDRGLI